jgi:uncharacterized membrane protein
MCAIHHFVSRFVRLTAGNMVACRDRCSTGTANQPSLAAARLRAEDAPMDMLEGETQVRDYALERAIMLSDGVFAIAMTLMAFELRPPDNWDHTLNTLLPAMIEPFKAFFWSFVATAAFWLNHRRLFGTYRRADGPISIINLLFLGEVVLIPVATRVLTELSYSRASLTLYLGLFGLIGATNAASWIYAALLTDIVRPPRRSVAWS